MSTFCRFWLLQPGVLVILNLLRLGSYVRVCDTRWDDLGQARTNLKVKGVGALDAMPLYFVASNPKMTAAADFTPKDKIASVAVRTSIEAVLLAMGGEKVFGNGQESKLGPLTVALSHTPVGL
jgi:hypothetical protein